MNQYKTEKWNRKNKIEALQFAAASIFLPIRL